MPNNSCNPLDFYMVIYKSALLKAVMDGCEGDPVRIAIDTVVRTVMEEAKKDAGAYGAPFGSRGRGGREALCGGTEEDHATDLREAVEGEKSRQDDGAGEAVEEAKPREGQDQPRDLSGGEQRVVQHEIKNKSRQKEKKEWIC